jgi:hypothetical protein
VVAPTSAGGGVRGLPEDDGGTQSGLGIGTFDYGDSGMEDLQWSFTPRAVVVEVGTAE